MPSSLMKKTVASYHNNIKSTGIACSLNRDIVSLDGEKIFLKAGTPITNKISVQINRLKHQGVIQLQAEEEQLKILETTSRDELVSSIIENVKNNPVISNLQLTDTLETINDYVKQEKIPEIIIEHLTVFAKFNPNAFANTLSNVIFGTHIGKANNYTTAQLNELIAVLFYEDIAFARLDPAIENGYKVHPIISKEILEYAGISNTLILESILQHEEKVDGSGYPYKITEIHEYAQISQIANHYSHLMNDKVNRENLLGRLVLLGQQFDFRTSSYKEAAFSAKLQKPLLKIMQERLKSKQQIIDYAQLIHQELAHLARWSNSDLTKNLEVTELKSKIKSSLWIEEDTAQPFKVKHDQLTDLNLCVEFINDAIKFMHNIAETTNYLNKTLGSPIERNGFPVSAEHFLYIANPLHY